MHYFGCPYTRYAGRNTEFNYLNDIVSLYLSKSTQIYLFKVTDVCLDR